MRREKTKLARTMRVCEEFKLERDKYALELSRDLRADGLPVFAAAVLYPPESDSDKPSTLQQLTAAYLARISDADRDDIVDRFDVIAARARRRSVTSAREQAAQP
jgi:hypothetical protein